MSNKKGISLIYLNIQMSGSKYIVFACRVKVLVEYFKMALDCFFAVWFVVGNVWIFGGHSSAEEAPNLYRYCHVIFITPSLSIPDI